MAVLGFGTWPLGGNAYGPVSLDDAYKALETAYENGIRLYDTANTYGDGDVEKILGTVFAGVDDIEFVTKAGYRTEAGNQQDFSAFSLERALTDSLTRLRRNRVNTFLLHSPDDASLANPDVRETTAVFLRNNLASHVGVSLRHIEQYPLLADWEEISVIELIFNLLDQRAMDMGILAHSRTSDRRVIARLPLCSGFLTGKYQTTSSFGRDDMRRRWSQEQLEKWITAASRFCFLEHGQRSLTQSALSFCIQTSGIFATIPGMKTPEQVLHNVGAIQPENALSEKDYVAIRQLWLELQNVPPQ